MKRKGGLKDSTLRNYISTVKTNAMMNHTSSGYFDVKGYNLLLAKLSRCGEPHKAHPALHQDVLAVPVADRGVLKLMILTGLRIATLERKTDLTVSGRTITMSLTSSEVKSGSPHSLVLKKCTTDVLQAACELRDASAQQRSDRIEGVLGWFVASAASSRGRHSIRRGLAVALRREFARRFGASTPLSVHFVKEASLHCGWSFTDPKPGATPNSTFLKYCLDWESFRNMAAFPRGFLASVDHIITSD